MVALLTNIINFVIYTTAVYNIDESHGLTHSMDVLNNANYILESELINNPYLSGQTKIIYVASVLHDMCDKKYINQEVGLTNIQEFLQNEKMQPNEIETVKNIMARMSYSKVKEIGYPNFGEYQMAYHIVREADLLSAYDFDRCMIYNIRKKNGNIYDAFQESCDLFDVRMLKHHQDNLFITSYSRKEAIKLHLNSINRIENWRKILRNPRMQ
jgi:HD superfamily phosphodiesterase